MVTFPGSTGLQGQLSMGIMSGTSAIHMAAPGHLWWRIVFSLESMAELLFSTSEAPEDVNMENDRESGGSQANQVRWDVPQDAQVAK